MYYTEKELFEMGIQFGKNVQIHRTVLFFGNNIQIGSNIRIDCYSVITSGEPVHFGDNIHIGAGVHIFGTAGLRLNDYCNLSSRCSLFTTSDDYTEGHLTNPTIPDEFKSVEALPVTIEKHVIIGCGSIVMPGLTIKQGASIGALSFVNSDIPAFTVVAGVPARKIGNRNQEQLIEMENKFKAMKKYKSSPPLSKKFE